MSWARDVADAVMAGGTLVPESTWAELGEWLDGLDAAEVELEDCVDRLKAAGFLFLENHLRSRDHREWIEDALHRITDEDPGRTLWVVPVDELICLHQSNEHANDGVHLRRLVFVGTEPELQVAIVNLTKIHLPVP